MSTSLPVRSIWRVPETRRWNSKSFLEWTGLPWQPRGTPSILPGTPGFPAPGTPVPTTPRRGKRGVYITVGQQLKHGATEGCPGCHCSDDDPKPRNKECRARFESLIAKERETKDPANDVEMGAGGSAPSRVGGTAQEKEAGGTVSGGEAGGPATSSGSKESHEAEASGVASKRDAAGSAGKEAIDLSQIQLHNQDRNEALRQDLKRLKLAMMSSVTC